MYTPPKRGKYIPKIEQDRPILNDAVLDIARLFNEMSSLKDSIITEIDRKIDEVDKKMTSIESEFEIIKRIQKGEPGKDADPQKIADYVLSRIPKPKDGQDADEKKIIESIKKEIPNENEIIKKVIKKIPESKASLKIIQESFETDPMSVIEEIMKLPDEKFAKFKLKTTNIDGLDQTIRAMQSQLGRGYLHGGGDTVKAGARITITTNNDGTKTISADLQPGTGDVFGPATNTADYIPQWNGANSKTLKDGLAVPAGGLAGLTALGLKADDSAVVHNTGNETVNGIKTFGSFPITPSSDPTTAYQVANKNYVDNILGNANALVYKGVIDCSGNPNYPAADAGHLYVVSVAGKIGGASGIEVEVGDMAICNTDGTVSGDQATVGTYWNIIQKNIVGAVTGPASATADDIAVFDSTTGKIIKDGGKKISDLVLKTTVQSKSFVITAPTDNSDLPLWRVPENITITAVHLLCKSQIIVGQLWQYDSNGLNGSTVDSSDITGIVDTNVDDDGTLSAPNITAGNYLGWKTTSATAGATYAIISFDYILT